MIRVCAWCGKRMETTDGVSDLITHGICDECQSFFMTNRPKSLQEFLNTLDAPVLCLDGDNRVLAANDLAAELIGQDASEMADQLCGAVMECAWSRLPEGCGRTEHCLGCAIKQAIRRCIESGKGIENQPAYLETTDDGGEPSRLRLLLTTECRGSVVLLRIDELTA